jgi:hypothetical protein
LLSSENVKNLHNISGKEIEKVYDRHYNEANSESESMPLEEKEWQQG